MRLSRRPIFFAQQAGPETSVPMSVALCVFADAVRDNTISGQPESPWDHFGFPNG